MREPPKLTEATLRAALRAHYGLSVEALTFLPIGNDAASFAFRVDAGASYFLKVRAEAGFCPASLLIPRFLSESGVPHLVSPLPTRTGRLWVRVDEYSISLYPLLAARQAAEVGLSDAHWFELGATLRRIHESRPPEELRRIVPPETFVPSRREVLTRLASVIARGRLTDSLQCEFAACWHARQDEIRTLIERADTLGGQLRRASLPRVLCHADLHTWNVLLDDERQMWIVDWDETIEAPKERDLMFAIGGIGRDLVSPQQTTCFLQGYGEATIDPQALAYYRCAWAVQDMGAYAEQVFFTPDLGEQGRRDALLSFLDLFAPGNIVAICADTWCDAAAEPTSAAGS